MEGGLWGGLSHLISPFLHVECMHRCVLLGPCLVPPVCHVIAIPHRGLLLSHGGSDQTPTFCSCWVQHANPFHRKGGKRWRSREGVCIGAD